MIRRPPVSTRTDTLVPYTTLFRSGRGGMTCDKPLTRKAPKNETQSAIQHVFNAGQESGLRVRRSRKRGSAMPAGTLYVRSEEHTSELQSLMRISYAVFCLKKKKKITTHKEQYRYSHKLLQQ